MKHFKIPILQNEYLYTMPAPIEPDLEYCNRNHLQKLKVNLVISLLSHEEVEQRFADELLSLKEERMGVSATPNNMEIIIRISDIHKNYEYSHYYK